MLLSVKYVLPAVSVAMGTAELDVEVGLTGKICVYNERRIVVAT